MAYAKGDGVPYRRRPKISPEMVRHSVLSAIDAGWDPMSRGRSINLTVEAHASHLTNSKT
ncbi:hypothetical protein KX729_32750 [Rhizobium sp. XQZ8]|uniref:hypothetical protein n=1 Tax=Rhizobium populisoli TaxID=2859785 RepID=UPI001CA5F3C2|nr:hypothetical protein [Rhizobium populisoli]MBW6426130.1 hypothetical protein [Rhizobium populisoli]